MKGRVFYGIAVAVSDRAVAVQDRAEIPHLKDGLLLDFRADQRALRAAHEKEQRVFVPCGHVFRTVAGALVEPGGRTKGARPPAFQPGLKFGPVEFWNFGEIRGVPGLYCHGGNAGGSGVQAGICFFTFQNIALSLFSSSNKQG